ncbi:MAG: energy transducer TonB, partial [Ignavibacteria bacterium]|nr:energy transducer TonB [Ignavibacteria bacterium]
SKGEALADLTENRNKKGVLMKTLQNKLPLLLIMIFAFLLITSGNSNGKSFFPGEDDYAIAVEKPATPVGGLEGIMKKASYPELAVKTKTEGKVYVLVLISEAGDVDDVKIVKGIGGGCDEETMRVVKKTKFTPGQNKGANVKSKLALAVQFKLPS